MLAPVSQETLKALQSKHPAPATDRRTPLDPDGNPRFEPLQVTKEDVQKALRSFTAGSSGGLDGLTPQHITDLLTGATDDLLHNALVDFANMLLSGACDSDISAVTF